jgi:hypothetical protein
MFKHLSTLAERVEESEDDPDDTLFVAMTAREASLVFLGLSLTSWQLPPLREWAIELQRRLIDLADAQKA